MEFAWDDSTLKQSTRYRQELSPVLSERPEKFAGAEVVAATRPQRGDTTDEWEGEGMVADPGDRRAARIQAWSRRPN